MPKITDIKVYIDGQERKLTLWYTSSNKFEVRGIPDRIKGWSPNLAFEYLSTEQDARDNIKELIENYHEGTKKVKKVIVYCMPMTSEMSMNKTENGFLGFKSWVPQGFTLHHNKWNSAAGMGFAIDYHILYMDESNGKRTFRRLNGGETSTLNMISIHQGGYKVIDWSQDRVDALEQIKSAMEEMVKNLIGVISDEKKMIDMLDSGRLLLSPQYKELEQ